MPPKSSPGADPYWRTADGCVSLHHGHAVPVLAGLRPKSVQCVVTSPPYWGLRLYSDATPVRWPDITYRPTTDSAPVTVPGGMRTYGTEDTPAEYVADTVHILRSIRRVLRDDGVVWWNLGDTYSGGGGGNYGTGKNAEYFAGNELGATANATSQTGLPGGSLVGIPWRVAFALQADDWVLRQDVIWRKPSPMPESVTNRCTKAHEYVFLLAKSTDYYYDNEAIKTVQSDVSLNRQRRGRGDTTKYVDEYDGQPGHSGQTAAPRGHDPEREVETTSNKRSVWEIDTPEVLAWLADRSPDLLGQYLAEATGRADVWDIAPRGYKGAHFATFPPELPETCIKAGTSEAGACPGCGTPWRRVVDKEQLLRERPTDYVKRTGAEGTGNSCSNSVAGVRVTTKGWEPGCGCAGLDPVPCVVLDPFVGSGTTCAVSVRLGRHAVGIDQSLTYLREHAAWRVSEMLRSVGRGKVIPGQVAAPVWRPKARQ